MKGFPSAGRSAYNAVVRTLARVAGRARLMRWGK